MAERINKEELRNALVRNLGMAEEEAMNALDCFFGLIANALETDRYVKVKGLGIFKLIDVEPHRIVNVNTGESVDTQGYRKVSFVPDASLKEVVNKPFAHFETVELRDGVEIEDVKSGIVQEVNQQDAAPRQVEELVDVLDEQPFVEESTELSGQQRLEEPVEPLMEELVEPLMEGSAEPLMEVPAEPLVEEQANQQTGEPVGQSVDMPAEHTDDKESSQRLEEGKVEALISRREELRELERQMDYEESRSRVAMGVIAVLMFLFVLCGLFFLLAPELLEELLF